MHFVRHEKPTILAIDDDSTILAALRETLTPAGYNFHTASEAGEAVRLAQYIVPDLVICDINLAGENGLEVCQEIKEQPDLLDLPVMFLSGAQIPDIIRRAHAAGGTYYLRKPFDPAVLLELVSKAMWMPALASSRVGV